MFLEWEDCSVDDSFHVEYEGGMFGLLVPADELRSSETSTPLWERQISVPPPLSERLIPLYHLLQDYSD